MQASYVLVAQTARKRQFVLSFAKHLSDLIPGFVTAWRNTLATKQFHLKMVTDENRLTVFISAMFLTECSPRHTLRVTSIGSNNVFSCLGTFRLFLGEGQHCVFWLVNCNVCWYVVEKKSRKGNVSARVQQQKRKHRLLSSGCNFLLCWTVTNPVWGFALYICRSAQKSWTTWDVGNYWLDGLATFVEICMRQNRKGCFFCRAFMLCPLILEQKERQCLFFFSAEGCHHKTELPTVGQLSVSACIFQHLPEPARQRTPPSEWHFTLESVTLR